MIHNTQKNQTPDRQQWENHQMKDKSSATYAVLRICGFTHTLFRTDNVSELSFIIARAQKQCSILSCMTKCWVLNGEQLLIWTLMKKNNAIFEWLYKHLMAHITVLLTSELGYWNSTSVWVWLLLLMMLLFKIPFPSTTSSITSTTQTDFKDYKSWIHNSDAPKYLRNNEN